MRFSNGLKDDFCCCYNCTIRNKETTGLYTYIYSDVKHKGIHDLDFHCVGKLCFLFSFFFFLTFFVM